MEDFFMYAKLLLYDDRETDDFEKNIELPSWEDVESIINRMDGHFTTEIILMDETEDNYLCIGGGNDGICNVYISKDDNILIKTLLNPKEDLNVYKLVTGGQLGNFDGIYCVSIEIAKEVAKIFFETGEECEKYSWE